MGFNARVHALSANTWRRANPLLVRKQMKPLDSVARDLENNRPFLAACLGLMSLPWLNPFASGPSSAFVPWLVSLACATLLTLVWRNIRSVDVSASWCIAALFSAILGLIQYFGIAAVFEPWINPAAPP